MKIQMIGIKDVEISIRERFSLTKERVLHVLEKYKQLDDVCGVVIISTCNRTEVYVSAKYSFDFNISQLLCSFLERDYAEYKDCFFEKSAEDALLYLSQVGAGVHSQIVGDDQIITQVRESLELSRTHGFSDSFLEVFFRTAITAAKEIKTTVLVRDAKTSSAPHRAVEKLKELCSLASQNVLVIGNGQMGRLVTELLIKEKANATVTLREYKKGTIQVPCGAKTIQYSNRYEAIENSSIIISATTSPHHTVYYDDFIKLKCTPKIMIDLAVPRDIDPKINSLDVKIFTIDDLCDSEKSLASDKIIIADSIAKKHIERYKKWISNKMSRKEL